MALNLEGITQKINHWTNIELHYLGTGNTATPDRYKSFEVRLVRLNKSILELEAELFDICQENIAGRQPRIFRNEPS
jgi:hypothetical protein